MHSVLAIAATTVLVIGGCANPIAQSKLPASDLARSPEMTDGEVFGTRQASIKQARILPPAANPSDIASLADATAESVFANARSAGDVPQTVKLDQAASPETARPSELVAWLFAATNDAEVRGDRSLVGDTTSNSSTLYPTDPVDFPWTFDAESTSELKRQWTPLERIEDQTTASQIFPGQVPVRLNLAGLLAATLSHSKQIGQLQIQPTEIRQLVNQEYGVFDPAAFVESQFDVQNLQQKREEHQVRAGFRKQHVYGGDVEISGGSGIQDNLLGFNLSDQGSASFQVIYNQEFLRDGGKDVVLSRALKASFQFDQRYGQSLAESNELIQQTLQAYWSLYEARANYFVQKSLSDVAFALMGLIEERSNQFQRSANSVQQAHAQYLESKADVVNARTRVLQAQDTLYRLVNDPNLDPANVEWITAEVPIRSSMPFDGRAELAVAIQNRGEIKERIAAVRQTAIDQQVSLNQLLPRLSFSLRSSFNGFEGDRDFAGAFSNLHQLPPSAAAGVELEMFLTNRAARARNKEAQLRLSRLQLAYEDQIEAIRQDVSLALREVNNAGPEIALRQQTLESRQREVDAIAENIWIHPDEGASVGLQLEQLYQAINRLVRTQQQIIASKVRLQTAMVDLQRAKGTLVGEVTLPIDIDAPVPRPAAALHQWIGGQSMYQRSSNQRVQQAPLPNYR